MRGIAAAAGILLILVAIGITMLLHSSKFHSFVLREAQQRASAALGSQVLLRNYSLTWSGISPTLDIYGVVVHGAAPYPDPPLLTVDHARVGVTITSLLKRTWYLNDVRLDHPVVRAFVDRQGNDNLPKTKSSGQKSNTNIFDLGVRHAVLDRGEVYYNNRKSVLEADLHDLTFRAAYQPPQNEYTGTLSYRDGHLRTGTYNPLPHALDAKFSLTPQKFTLENADLRSGNSQFVLKATVSDYSKNPRAEAQYQATLDTVELRRVMKNPSLPGGVLRASGRLNYVSQPNRPMLATLTVNGNLSSTVLTMQTSSMRVQVRNIGAQYSLANGNLVARDIHADLLGGALNGTLAMQDLTGNSHSHLHAALQGVKLADLKTMANSASLRQVSISGGMNATVDAAWGKTMNDLAADANASLQSQIAPTSGGNAVPVSGAVHAHYAAPQQQVTLMNTYLRMPQTSIDLSGTVSKRSALEVRMQSSDLHELENVVDLVRPPQSPLGLYGTASFNGTVTGSTSAPQVAGRFTAADLKVKGSAWRSIAGNVDLGPAQAKLQNAQLVPADGGQIRMNVSAGLRHWSFENTSPFQANLNASGVDVANLTHAAGVQTPLAGRLAANVAVRGTELNPAGQGNVSLTKAKISGQPVKAATVRFQGTGNQVHADLAVQVGGAGGANGSVDYFPKQQRYDAVLRAAAIDLSQLQAVKDRNIPLKGTLNLNAQGRGSVHNPELQASLQIPKLEMRDQTISGINLQASLANHVGTYTLDSQVLQTSVQSHGTVQLTGDYYANATLDTQVIPLEPLVAAFAPSQAGAVTGQTELHATLKGPLKKKALLDAHATIPQLTVSYKNAIHLAEVSPIRIDYANGTLNIPRAGIRGTDTDLQFQGTVPVTDRTAPVSLLLQGTMGLQLAQALNPDVASSGQIRFDINSYGQTANPNVEGTIRLEKVNFATGSVPIGLQNGNGVLTLTRDRLDITQFEGEVGGGKVQASGGVVYRPALTMNLAVTGNRMRLLYPGGIRAEFGTHLALTGTPKSSLLQGQVRVEELSFTRDFDLQKFMGELGGGAATPPPKEGFTQDLKLNVGVNSSGGMNLQSRQLALQAAANLRVVGTASQPVVLGRVNINGGDLIFGGNRYVLQGGTIDFVNPAMTQPVVNVNITTTIQQYNLLLRFWGPADHLHTSYTSDPALPPADIINLIARGTTTEAAAANPSPPGALGAESLVASTVSSQVTSRISELAGISQLSVDPVLGGNGQSPGARLAIQQRVTGKIFVNFATDITSTSPEDQLINLEYQATPKVSVSGTRDQNGGFGFDVKIHKNW